MKEVWLEPADPRCSNGIVTLFVLYRSFAVRFNHLKKLATLISCMFNH